MGYAATLPGRQLCDHLSISVVRGGLTAKQGQVKGLGGLGCHPFLDPYLDESSR